jgi:D-serine deaminase-like pyridoxal phosphate-dependent protein
MSEGSSIPWTDMDMTSLDTPTIVVSLPRLEANIARMAADVSPVSLRPHVKTHKSVAVAQMQVDHGAAGLTVATIGEAEVFARSGFDDLFIAFAIRAAGPKARRLRAVAERVRLRVGVDSESSAALLADALRGTAAELVIEVDSGGHRTGTTSVQEVIDIARAAARGGVPVVGVFTHGGHSYAERGARERVALEEIDALVTAAEALERDGHEASVISAGSTPTAVLAAQSPVTEVRPGTYVFQDRLQVELGSCTMNEVSLMVASTVVSRHAERLVLDAGAKTLSKDLPGILQGYGTVIGYPHLQVERLYDHHAVVSGVEGRLPQVGEVLWIVPNHVCPVVDLSDEFWVDAGDGRGLERWPVDARGRSR